MRTSTSRFGGGVGWSSERVEERESWTPVGMVGPCVCVTSSGLVLRAMDRYKLSSWKGYLSSDSDMKSGNFEGGNRLRPRHGVEGDMGRYVSEFRKRVHGRK